LEKKFNKIGGIIAIVFLIVMLIIGLYKRYLLIHNFEFVAGKVTEITLPGWKSSGDYSVLYEYQVSGKLYRSNNNYNYCGKLGLTKLSALLVGKSFPVAYAVKDASTGVLLLTEEGADKFHYKLPDSVKFYDSMLTCKQ
jgi:hypothetical protein